MTVSKQICQVEGIFQLHELLFSYPLFNCCHSFTELWRSRAETYMEYKFQVVYSDPDMCPLQFENFRFFFFFSVANAAY